MAYEVDRLEIVIETATKRANKELDNLISKLNKVSTSLRSVAVAATQINKANQAISKTNEKLSKTSQLSRKAAVELSNSSSSMVNSSIVERLEMERKEVALRRLIELQKTMNGTSQRLIGWSPQLPAVNSPEMETERLNEEYARFHQEEQARAERTRAAWEKFINTIKESMERMNLMSQSYEELNAKIGNYDGSLTEAMNAVVKLRQETEAYRQIMSGVTDVTNLSAQEQEKISEAYRKVANAANEARAAQEILKASELANNKGFGMSNLVGKDIQKEIIQFNAEYTKTRYNAKKVNEEMAKHKTHMGGANASLLKMRRTLLNVISLVYVIRRAWSAVNKALDFGETINLFQTVFRKIGQDAGEQFEFAFLDRAEQFRDKLVDALHLDPDDTMNFMANFAQMASSMGVVTETAYRMSESLTALAGDVASLYNIDIETAMGRLKAGLSGQSRPMRMMNVDITKTSLQMIALKYGITESIETMDAAAKVQLRYLAMTERLTVAMGDMARTIDSPANQLRILKQQWDNFTRTIGTVFVPMVTSVLPVINGLVMALTHLVGTLAEVAGYSEPDFTDETIYAFEDLDDQAEETEETLQKLRATLGGFDELNILSSGQNEDIMGSGFEVLDEAIIKSNEAYMGALNEQIGQMTDKAKVWKQIFQDIVPIILTLTSTMAALKVMSIALAGSFTALGAITVLATMLYTVTALVTQWDELDKGVKFVLLSLAGLSGVALAILAIKNATVLWTAAQTALNVVMNLNPIVLVITAIIVALAALIVYWDEVVAALTPVFNHIGQSFLTSMDEIVKGFNASIAWIVDVWDNAIAGIVDIWDNSIAWIVDTWQSFVAWIVRVFKPVTDFFSTMWDGLVDGFESAWNFIKGMFSGIGNWFGDVGSGIGDVFKDLLNTLIKGLNWALTQPFNAINNILKGIRDINILGGKPFGWVSTVNVPQIPMLANGGIVDYGQMFVAREAGAELVGGFGNKTGVMNNEQIVDAVSAGVANAVAQVMSQVDFGGRGEEQNVNVFLDGRQISSAIEQTRRQQGVSIVRGGNK